jgi:uncharacterized protein YndB with AHSA1/START domain
MTDATQELVMSRVFDAPRELVYKAFTDEDQLAQWFGPVGWSVPRDTVSVDLRVGGHQRFTMVNDEDPTMASPVSSTFTEVIENELLVGRESVEGIPGFEGVAEMYVRLEFHDAGDGKTRLELRQGPYSIEMEGNAREGWGSSFTKLDALLAA